jgi:hypothetical protein
MLLVSLVGQRFVSPGGPALLVGLVHQCFLLRGRLTLFIGVVGQCFLPRGRRLSSPFVHHCRLRAEFLLVSQVGKSGLALLPLCSLLGKVDLEAVVAKPKEDSLGCRHLLCTSSAFGHKAMSSLLVEKVLTMCSLLVEKPLTSGFLVEMALVGFRLEAMALVLPQVIDPPLPSPVGVFRAGMSPKKNGPPRRFWRQQAGGLLVFAKCSLEPFLIAKGTTNISRGIEISKIVKHPAGGAWGRLRPLVLQPRQRIGEGGRGQMSRR